MEAVRKPPSPEHGGRGRQTGVSRSFYIDQSTLDQITATASATGLSRSALVNELLRIGLRSRQFKELVEKNVP